MFMLGIVSLIITAGVLFLAYRAGYEAGYRAGPR